MSLPTMDMMWWLYVILFIFICYIILNAYIRIKMKFWYTQPIFHLYNLWYWVNPPGLLYSDPPPIKKYTNIVNIKQYDINTIDKSLLDAACHFIKNYYVQSPHTKYIPQQKNIVEYLKSSNQASYLTLYQTPKIL